MNVKKYMMKNIIQKVLVLVLLVLVLGACTEEFFNEIPSDRIIPEQHYNSMVEAELSCRTPIAILRDIMPQMVFASELLSDLTVTTENADLYWQDINNHNLSADNPYLDPSVFYQVIINANESLQYIDSIVNKDMEITQLQIDIYKGNLVGIRSWAYFMIARLYGEVAYIPDNVPQLPENAFDYLGREAIMDTLINQLRPYLNIDYLDYGNLSMYNKALLGEIFLEKQQYDSAVVHLQNAISGYENQRGIYKVTNDYEKDGWEEIFINADFQSTEVMIAVPFTYTQQQSNPIEFWYGYKEEYIAKPTNYIVDLFNNAIDQKDNKGDQYRGLGVSIDTLEGNYFVNKYNLNKGVLYSSDIILYRAGDIHLLLAEALNRTGQSEIAWDILNHGYNAYRGWNDNEGIRGRAYLSKLSIEDKPAGIDLVSYVEDMIIQERASELAFEGKRWLDLMRVARRREPAYLANKVAAKYSDSTVASRVKEELMNEENWYLPFVK
jgi:hypothetical protein